MTRPSSVRRRSKRICGPQHRRTLIQHREPDQRVSRFNWLHPRRQPAERNAPVRLNNARKLQRTLCRVAKQQPKRRFTLLYDKVCRRDILQEAWQRVKSNKGAAGVDQMDINAIREYGEERFLNEVEQELRSRRYRTALVRRVHIPKPGQPGKSRPLGIPTVKDRVVQMAVKLVIEPLFEADFLPCSFGFRPKRTPRMALSAIVQSVNDGYTFVVDVDLKSYLDLVPYCPRVNEKVVAGHRPL